MSTNLVITRINFVTGAKVKTQINFNQQLTKETLEQLHWLLESNHPDDCINFDFNNGGFIYGTPVNMRLDDELRNKGQMTADEYYAKWYPTPKMPM